MAYLVTLPARAKFTVGIMLPNLRVDLVKQECRRMHPGINNFM
jgi:hypothetical protein